MTLQEYYGFPDGINVELDFYNYYENIPDFTFPPNMESAFNGQYTRTFLNKIDTSNVTNMKSMFSNCLRLITIEDLNTTNVTNMENMFAYCSGLVSLPAMYAGNLTQKFSNYGLFNSYEIPMLYQFGGLIDLKVSMDGNYGFNKCPNLTYESCINIIDGLYDFTKHGETPTSGQGRLKVGQSFLDKLTDEDIQKAIDKGWTLLA